MGRSKRLKAEGELLKLYDQLPAKDQEELFDLAIARRYKRAEGIFESVGPEMPTLARDAKSTRRWVWGWGPARVKGDRRLVHVIPNPGRRKTDRRRRGWGG